jgi:DNA-directed RNA polymerase specialized sigma subunit
MITKQQLKSIPLLDARIDSKIAQARELREKALCVQSTSTTADRVQSSRHPDPMVIVDKLVDAEAAITAEIDQLVDLRTEAATLFKSLPERDCLLMELRYLEGLTWEKVAERMTYGIRQVLRIHGDILISLFPDT